jgi:hypothetical protein
MGGVAEGCNRERRSAVTHHVRNPIRRHGELPSDQFTIIPNELVRDPDLSNHAYRIAMVLRSHAEDYEVSAASLSKMLGWHRETVGKALRELVDARRLAVQRYRTAKGGRAYDVYHVHVSGHFTDAEMLDLSESVVLGASHAYDIDRSMLTDQTWGCLPRDHPPADGQDTKEEQLEDQPENKKEHQRPSEVPSGCRSFREDVGSSTSDLPSYQRRSRSRKDSPTTSASSACWGCVAFSDGCMTHGPTRQPATV